MVKFYTIGMIEKYNPFVSATTAADYTNGAFGDVADGVFTVGATKFKVLMNKGKGHSMYTDFTVEAGESSRVCDLSKLDGEYLLISPEHLPSTFKATDKLVSDTTGKLVVSASAVAPYLLVDSVVEFDGKGAKVKIVAE